jgi:hypothetical protein
MVGSFILNFLVPNGQQVVSGAAEGAIYNATGFKMDLNGDGQIGKYGDEQKGDIQLKDAKSGADGGNVDGIE